MVKKQRREQQATVAKELSDILVVNGVMTESEGVAMRHEFEQSSQDNVVDFLIDEGIVSVSDMLVALSQYYQVPAFDVVGHFFERHYLTMFPKGFLLRSAIVPLEQDGNIMVIVASHPNNQDLLAEIGQYVSYDIQFRVGIAQDICDAVKEYYEESLTQEEQDAENDDNKEKERSADRVIGQDPEDLGWDEEYGE